jgi:hypothetical protein
MVQNLSVLFALLQTVILLKISGVANVSKNKFTLRSWQRSFLDITLRVISDKSSGGKFRMLSGMALGAKIRQGFWQGYLPNKDYEKQMWSGRVASKSKNPSTRGVDERILARLTEGGVDFKKFK